MLRSGADLSSIDSTTSRCLGLERLLTGNLMVTSHRSVYQTSNKPMTFSKGHSLSSLHQSPCMFFIDKFSSYSFDSSYIGSCFCLVRKRFGSQMRRNKVQTLLHLFISKSVVAHKIVLSHFSELCLLRRVRAPRMRSGDK